MLPALLSLALLASPPVALAELVSQVRVEVPEPERERIAGYVSVRPGEPLSRVQVRESAARLYATGAFADVIVETRRLEDGLEVVFRTTPAPRLDRVRIEGDQVVEEGELRRLTRLEKREPLWPTRLEQAATAAAVELADRGYLEARVTAEARPVAGGADAIFHVTAGPQARVSEVTLVGLDGYAAWGISERMRPRAGAPFDRRRAQQAAESIRRELVQRRRFQARVTTHEVYDPSSASIRLTFQVEAAEPVKVELRGAPAPKALQQAVERLLQEGGGRSDALEAAAEQIEEHFQSRGHRDVVVIQRREFLPGHVAFVYEIDPGPRSMAVSVRVTGDAVPDVVLRTRAGDPVQDGLLDADVSALRRALEDRGHATPLVEAEVPEGGGSVPVVFRVRAGALARVRSYQALLLEPNPGGVVPPASHVRVGEPFRVRDVARERNALLSVYRNAGHLAIEVTPEVAFSEDRTQADVTLSVDAGPRTTVGRVVVAGLGHTQERVVQRELTIQPGEPLSLERVLESQRRLAALGIFARADIRELGAATDPIRDLVVSIVEAPRTTIAYGIGYGERDRLRASIELTRRNLGGLDRSLTLFTRGSFRGNRVFASYRTPYLFGHRQEFFLSGFREEEDRESFDFVRYGSLVQTALRLSPRHGVILRYVYQSTDTFNEEVPCGDVDRQFCDATVAGPAVTVVNDTRDDPIDPIDGRFLSADVQLSLEALGGDSFVKGFFQASLYTPAAPRVVLGLNGRLGLARTLGPNEPLLLPLPERFFAGGDFGPRGFATDAVAPGGGNALLLGSAELRIDAARKFSVAVFCDVGNIYPLVSDMDIGDLRYTAGAGLRYKSALGPLRVDWGYKLDRRPGESPSHWHFTIGNAF